VPSRAFKRGDQSVNLAIAFDADRCEREDGWYGWQTKWWELDSGRAIGNGRKEDILDSIQKTEKHVPEITDWVLWTRRPLTAADQTWFYGLETQTKMRLHLWTEDALDELLVGDAALLRETYFGELILTKDRLADIEARAAAEVGERWMPDVHQPALAERRLRQMLAEPQAWANAQDAGREIGRFATAVEDTMTAADPVVISEIRAIVATAQDIAKVLDDAHGQLEEGRLTTMVGVGRRTAPVAPPANPVVLRRLRACQRPTALPLTNLLAHARDAARLAHDIDSDVATRLAVVTGRAGFGKTQLAAALSAPTADRPAGVLIYGRHLGRHGTLNDLARQVTIAGAPVASFEALLAAVDAAATRAGCRLPIVIDGLNESEAPMTWTPLLRSLLLTLEGYPSVLVVCTIRDAFLEAAVPAEVSTILTLDGFSDLDEAIDRYFAFYKIEPGEAELPLELLNHPLSLKIFCDVANPERKYPVSVERLPTSLTGMFDEYFLAVGRRVAELNPSINPYDVAQAVDALGTELWHIRARDVSEERARQLFNDTGRRWEEGLLTALEREGVLIRQPSVDGALSVSLVYDLMAGHVIATSLVRAWGGTIANLLGTGDATRLLAGEWTEQHPLAADVFDALVGKVPRAGAQQLWQIVQEPLRLPALLRAAGLEADYIDTATVQALAENVDDIRGPRGDLFDRLFITRAAPLHPLNAKFLDQLLRDRAVADRDLRWSEWLRGHARSLLADARALATRWKESSDRSGADQLRALWLMWTLTSTDRALRDAATAALYWFGRHDVAGLFGLAEEAITINDDYVGERVVAAVYGVTTSKQLHDPMFEAALSTYLQALLTAFVGADVVAPTWHSLIRYYVSGSFEFASRFYPSAVPLETTLPLVFAAAPIPEPLHEGDPRRDVADQTLNMDFGNYTLGRLFPDRSNYDYDHPGHRSATDRLLGVVYELGWRSDLFEDAEHSIVYAQRERDPGRLERYGKKYGWVGFHTVAGMLTDTEQPLEALEVDIDPTFPQPPPTVPIEVPTWARRTPVDDLRWLRAGVVKVPDELLTPSRLDDEHGRWILVHAEFEARDTATGRSTYGLFNTVLVETARLGPLLEAFNSAPHPGRDLIDVPGDYYIFAGEIPWHHRFASPEHEETVNDLYQKELWPRGGTPRFERLAHSFNWESHHSLENQANGYVPSRLFSEKFDLRSVPSGFDQVEPSGAYAARCVSAPAGFEDGELLYLRDDLVRRYAEDRAIVTFAFGERRTQFTWPERPTGAKRRIYMNHENVWRIVKQH